MDKLIMKNAELPEYAPPVLKALGAGLLAEGYEDYGMGTSGGEIGLGAGCAEAEEYDVISLDD